MQAKLQHELLNALEAFLLSRTGEISEQELLSQLQTFFPVVEDLNADALLFQQHFVLYHHLYVLKAAWLQQQVAHLTIGYAKVSIESCTAVTEHQVVLQPEADDKAAYYLDWANLFAMTDERLRLLLEQFWQSYHAGQHAEVEDISVLLEKWQLTGKYDIAMLKKSYRQQALQLHPDRGGLAADFQQLQQEYQCLLSHLLV